MAKQYITVDLGGWWQTAQPGQLFLGDALVGMPIRRPGRCWVEGKQLALVIAGDMHPWLRDQHVSSLSWHQRPREVIAKSDDLVDIVAGQIGYHSFKGRKVSVNVRKEGDAHAEPHDGDCSLWRLSCILTA